MVIQLAIKTNFVSSEDTDKSVKCIQKSNNIEVIIYDKADEVIGKIFESLANRHQTGNIDDK